jgi:hypothetical protein
MQMGADFLKNACVLCREKASEQKSVNGFSVNLCSVHFSIYGKGDTYSDILIKNHATIENIRAAILRQ